MQDESGLYHWVDLPHRASYLWTYLASHLVGAQRAAELADTVKDIYYLVMKTYLRQAYATEADLLATRQVAPSDPVLTRLHQAFSQSSHLLGQGKILPEIANTFHSRLVHRSGLAKLVTAREADLPKPLLTAPYRLPDLPDSSLIRTVVGHGVPIFDCAMSADGSTIVSFARDTILKVWDAQTGAERFTLTGHQIMGNCCALNADGSIVVSGSLEGVLKIWDATTGAERFSIKAHLAPVHDCALGADGTVAVSASKDKTLKVWETSTGTEQ